MMTSAQETTARRTLEQSRALYAHKTIKSHEGDGNENLRRYVTLVRSLPSMVLQNGLGQALAYLLADAEGNSSKPSYKLYSELQTWLSGGPSDCCKERVYPDPGDGDLVQQVMSGSRLEYRRAQESALLLLAWMRKFTDAYLGPKVDAHRRQSATEGDVP